MSRLLEIKDYVEKEYLNLYKNKTRARSLEGILSKRNLLVDHLNEFESILTKLEYRLTTKDWNKFTDDFDYVKNKVSLSLKILDGSVVIPEKEKDQSKNRRRSENCLEYLATGDFSLSSTLITDCNSDEENQVELNRSSFLEHVNQLEEEYNEQNKYIEETNKQNQKNLYLYFKNLKRKSSKMNYEFPTERAIQCIPEYRGSSSELDSFIYQIEYFYKQIPKGESDEPLIHVVLLKLKGPASLYFRRIKADTWKEVKTNLIKEFQESFKVEEIFKKIETLEQGYNEQFQSYKDRALALKESIEDYEKIKNENESYALRNLRIHFLAGLKNQHLKNLAKNQKSLNFKELLEYLQEECIELEQIEDIEKRLENMKLRKPGIQQRFRHKYFPINQYNQNRFDNQRYNSNQIQTRNTTHNSQDMLYNQNYNNNQQNHYNPRSNNFPNRANNYPNNQNTTNNRENRPTYNNRNYESYENEGNTFKRNEFGKN